jgi:hypothetical protein
MYAMDTELLLLSYAGSVPGIAEANHEEPLLPFGNRYNQGRIVLGARVEQACSSPAALQQAAKQYKGEK